MQSFGKYLLVSIGWLCFINNDALHFFLFIFSVFCPHSFRNVLVCLLLPVTVKVFVSVCCIYYLQYLSIYFSRIGKEEKGRSKTFEVKTRKYHSFYSVPFDGTNGLIILDWHLFCSKIVVLHIICCVHCIVIDYTICVFLQYKCLCCAVFGLAWYCSFETIFFDFYEKYCHHFLFFPNLLPFLPSSGIYLYIFYYFCSVKFVCRPAFLLLKTN